VVFELMHRAVIVTQHNTERGRGYLIRNAKTVKTAATGLFDKFTTEAH